MTPDSCSFSYHVYTRVQPTGRACVVQCKCTQRDDARHYKNSDLPRKVHAKLHVELPANCPSVFWICRAAARCSLRTACCTAYVCRRLYSQIHIFIQFFTCQEYTIIKYSHIALYNIRCTIQCLCCISLPVHVNCTDTVFI